ncbi:uncharacterized protein LOC113291638 [Papaver somniferum]|uniref:uncharacterized protein LOC113291638 n=1 Tax=Papaver somniferum TaxID=3469 RepID=UPI000E702347|nr:uncharacterized protein LOC113291638 [Papaver somniferum]
MDFMKFIPKKEDSATVKDFRPLSFISSFYKIVSKLLDERIKVLIPGLIFNTQCAFIKNKHILDGIIIANECINSRLRQKKPGILCKIGMGKAFDNVNCPSLFTILRKNGFGEKLEVLSMLLDDAVANNKIGGFQVMEGGTMISHMQFADDTIIMLNASHLERYCLLLIWDIPIGASKRSVTIWDVVIERMKNKLVPWKRKFLNKAASSDRVFTEGYRVLLPQHSDAVGKRSRAVTSIRLGGCDCHDEVGENPGATM